MAGAAAEVAGQGLTDPLAAGLRLPLQQGTGHEQDAGSAVAALRGSQLGEGLLQRVQPRRAAQALDGRDLSAGQLHRKQEAAELRASVDENRAGAALAKL